MDQSLKFESKGQGPLIVFSHGTPTYSGEYDAVVDKLKEFYSCILIDHLGFGYSPKPRYADYSLEAHQRRFKETLLKNDVKSFHLVVHDFGGVIALPLLFDSDFKVLSLTVLNSWYWPLIETEPQIKSQKPFLKMGLLPFLYRYLNFSPKVLLKMAWGSHSALSKDRHEHYIKMFPTRESRSGTIGFLRALFDFDHSAWKNSEKLKELHLPIQMLWGTADKLISTRNLTRWKELLPSAKVIELENVGHFVAEEASEVVTQELSSFLKEIK